MPTVSSIEQSTELGIELRRGTKGRDFKFFSVLIMNTKLGGILCACSSNNNKKNFYIENFNNYISKGGTAKNKMFVVE